MADAYVVLSTELTSWIIHSCFANAFACRVFCFVFLSTFMPPFCFAVIVISFLYFGVVSVFGSPTLRESDTVIPKSRFWLGVSLSGISREEDCICLRQSPAVGNGILKNSPPSCPFLMYRRLHAKGFHSAVGSYRLVAFGCLASDTVLGNCGHS